MSRLFCSLLIGWRTGPNGNQQTRQRRRGEQHGPTPTAGRTVAEPILRQKWVYYRHAASTLGLTDTDRSRNKSVEHLLKPFFITWPIKSLITLRWTRLQLRRVTDSLLLRLLLPHLAAVSLTSCVLDFPYLIVMCLWGTVWCNTAHVIGLPGESSTAAAAAIQQGAASGAQPVWTNKCTISFSPFLFPLTVESALQICTSLVLFL